MKGILLIVGVIVVVLLGCKLSELLAFRDSKSTKLYKERLLKSCVEYLANPNTTITLHKHKFDWDYGTSALEAKWKLFTNKYIVTLWGKSEVVMDTAGIDEFIKNVQFTQADIFTGEDNISVLHHYKNKEDVDSLVEAVRTIEHNNKEKAEYEKH